MDVTKPDAEDFVLGDSKMLSGEKISRFVLVIVVFASLVTYACHKSTATAPAPPTAANPTPPTPPPAITLRADPGTIQRGASLNLQWESRNAGAVRIEPGLGEVTATGTRQVSPPSSVTYTATATGPGGTATDTVRVTVNEPPPPPPKTPAAPTNPKVTIDELFRTTMEVIYFDYDSAEIRSDQIPRLQRDVAFLKENSNLRFTVEGHCDERGSEEYNIGLGDRRANAVKQFMVSQGILDSRINVVSYGEERPICHDETEKCFQENRRAAFALNP
jgi:peptidoglycan-associated lipoprotein